MTLHFRLSQLAVFFSATIVLGVQICQVTKAFLATGSISTFECSIGGMALAIAGSVFHRAWRNSVELRLLSKRMNSDDPV